MAKETTKYGRTLYDVIAEHPKKTVLVFCLILIAVIVLLLYKVPFKIGALEIGGQRHIVRDTIVKHDTVFLTKYVTKEIPNAKSNSEVKANVNSYDQQGGQTANQINNSYYSDTSHK